MFPPHDSQSRLWFLVQTLSFILCTFATTRPSTMDISTHRRFLQPFGKPYSETTLSRHAQVASKRPWPKLAQLHASRLTAMIDDGDDDRA